MTSVPVHTSARGIPRRRNLDKQVKQRSAGAATVRLVSIAPKVVLLLTFGPADGLMFSVPADDIPAFVIFGSSPIARYERVPGEGEVLCYRFSPQNSGR